MEWKRISIPTCEISFTTHIVCSFFHFMSNLLWKHFLLQIKKFSSKNKLFRFIISRTGYVRKDVFIQFTTDWLKSGPPCKIKIKIFGSDLSRESASLCLFKPTRFLLWYKKQIWSEQCGRVTFKHFFWKIEKRLGLKRYSFNQKCYISWRRWCYNATDQGKICHTFLKEAGNKQVRHPHLPLPVVDG